MRPVVDPLHALEVAGLVAALGAGDDARGPSSWPPRAAASTLRMPVPSTATGFSVKRCLPALMAASMCWGRKPGGVASITRSQQSMTF